MAPESVFEADEVCTSLNQLKTYLDEYANGCGGTFEVILVNDHDVTETHGYNLVVRAGRDAKATRIRLSPKGGNSWNIRDLLKRSFDKNKTLDEVANEVRISDVLRYGMDSIVFEVRRGAVQGTQLLRGVTAP
ncbi:MAG TPA: hypothetical protein VK502_04525 [Candidatus Saccharimonadales bacterium]|nr:hypothetical protein [Candidatus Saccharimonadales bacterium]